MIVKKIRRKQPVWVVLVGQCLIGDTYHTYGAMKELSTTYSRIQQISNSQNPLT